MGKYDDNLGLFPNEYKEKGDNKPSFKGRVTISHETLRALVQMSKSGAEPTLDCAAWVHDWNGGKRISVKMQPLEEKPKEEKPRRRAKPQPEPEPDFLDDDIGF